MSAPTRVTGKPIAVRLAEIHPSSVVHIHAKGVVVSFTRGSSYHRANMRNALALDVAVLGTLCYLTSRDSHDPELLAALETEWPRLRAEVGALVAAAVRAVVGAHCDLVGEDDLLDAHRLGHVGDVLNS